MFLGYECSIRDYFVFYLFYGIGGDEEVWLGLGWVVQIMDNFIVVGKVKLMIVVMFNGNVVQEVVLGNGSVGFVQLIFMLLNMMDGQFEKIFGDIMNFVEFNYWIFGIKEGRVIVGFLMGGYYIVYIFFNYLNIFNYIGLFFVVLNVNLEGLFDLFIY